MAAIFSFNYVSDSQNKKKSNADKPWCSLRDILNENKTLLGLHETKIINFIDSFS